MGPLNCTINFTCGSGCYSVPRPSSGSDAKETEQRHASWLLGYRQPSRIQGEKSCACLDHNHLCVGYQITAAARSSGRGRCQCLGQPGYRALGDFGAGGSWALWTRKGESGGWLSSNLIKNCWISAVYSNRDPTVLDQANSTTAL